MNTLELTQLNELKELNESSGSSGSNDMTAGVDLLRDEETARMFGGAAELGRGRKPFAFARICGDGEGGEIKGQASFYYTPLGMLVCATVKGLGGGRGVYSLSVSDGKNRNARAALQCAIPPLYERGGHAWCSALTGKISPDELFGKRITLRELKRGGEVATGMISNFTGLN